MYVIEVSEDKFSCLADTIGKAMKSINEMFHDCSRIGFRDEEDVHDRMDERSYGRGRYNMRDDDMRNESRDRMDERYPRERYNMRDEEDVHDHDRMDERYPRERWGEMPPYMGERRGRSAYTGRYVRR